MWVIKRLILVVALSVFAALPVMAESFQLIEVLPLSGSASLVGEQHRIGAELALEAYRDELASHNIDLSLRFEDDQGQPAQTVEIFRRTRTDKSSGVYLAGLSSTSMMLKSLVEKEGGLLVSTAAHPGLTVNSQSVIRNFFTVADARGALVEFMQRKGLKKLALLYSEDELGQGAYEDIQRSMENSGIKLTTAASFDRQASDFKSLLLNIKSKKPDLLYLVGIGPAMGLALRQVKAMGITVPIIGWVFCSQSVVLSEGPEVTNGVLSVDPVIAEDSERYQKFKTLFQRNYPDKKIEIGTIFEYDAVSIVIQALLSGARTPNEIHQWIISQKSFNLTAGEVSFNSSGEANYRMRIGEINHRK